jgi:(1->4)-alpha-D-glucan 1-alpha-D-glucosylmutase
VRIPVSTYRVQFNREFRFSDAGKIVDYLHALGITDLYASPILKARPGSAHGYDVIDPTTLNPEIGAREEFDEFCSALQARGMGLLVDVVPNHMAANIDNPWWFDVLEKGPASLYARFFDVDWKARKILLPILATPYGEALDNRELVLRIENGQPLLQYYGYKLPIAAGAEHLGVESLDRILSQQHYRLTYWRKATDGTNYRRFFDINDLVSLRAELDEVFQATHSYVLELLKEGQITGLRIDHIDGLLEPANYLARLPETYVVSEKILAGHEQLPCEWRTQGTTGYDFMNFVNGIFVDEKGFRSLEQIYVDYTGCTKTLQEVCRECKIQVMKQLFAGELNGLVNRLVKLAEDDRHARDIGTENLRQAFIAVTAYLPVYRTYIASEQVSKTDRATIENTIAAAGKGDAFDFLRRVLFVQPAWYLQDRKPEYLDFVRRWQQFTGPVMAKGLEDTTFYRNNPLISLNEVGGDCEDPATYFGVEQFHRRNLARHASWPHTLNATSTHDTKRSEDVRARIDVLSEVPKEWARFLARRKRSRLRGTPAANEEILIYQTMLGAWPIDEERLKQYVIKALREGKAHTNWIDINESYERGALSFLHSLYTDDRFWRDFLRLQKTVGYFGALNSLSQLILKVISPGVPDFYQGTEVWDLSLADPDNRRPVDFTSRAAMLADLATGANLPALRDNLADGHLKLYVTSRLLHFRRQQPDLFREGGYVPLRVTGARSNHIIAFARRLHGQWCIVAVPRLCASLTRAGSAPVGKKVWRDTQIEMPADMPKRAKDILTSQEADSNRIADLFRTLPFAVIVSGC